MDVVDTHGHLGPSPSGAGQTDEADVLTAMDRHGVAATLVMPQPLQRDERAAHDRIHAFALAHPGRIHGMAMISPLWEDDASYATGGVFVVDGGLTAK